MSLEPQWTERISKQGRPEQPLRAMTVRIRMEQTIARGITTDVRARGRYFSGLCWAMYQVENSPLTEDLQRADKRALLDGLEEILALASYRRQQTEARHEAGISGITGRSNISNDALYDADSIDISSFTLLENTPYANRRFQSTLGNFYLKQGRWALTAAGEALAKSLDEIAASYFERMITAVEDGTVPLQLLDDISEVFTHQGCFTSTENTREQDALQRIILSVVDWNERDQTIELVDWPSQLKIRIDDYFEYIISEEQFENNLRDAVASHVHHLRRAWCLAILRAHDLIASFDYDTELAYDEVDKARFEPIRPLARVYYLQCQVAHALRAQLRGLVKHLRREAPEGVLEKELLAQIESMPIGAEATAALRSETIVQEGQMDQSAITRELFQTGRVTPKPYNVTVPTASDAEYETVGDLRKWLDENYVGRWQPTTDPEINGRTLIEATDDCFTDVRNATTQTEAISALSCLITRSTVQLVAAVKQYEQVVENHPLLKQYINQEFGQRYSSLPKTTQYLNKFGNSTPLASFARAVFKQRVIDIHDYIIQDRLGSGSISLAFTTGADAREDDSNLKRMLFAAGGAGAPGTGNLRYRDLRRLMRDTGLLTYQPDSGIWAPTDAGQTVIDRFRGEHK